MVLSNMEATVPRHPITTARLRLSKVIRRSSMDRKMPHLLAV